MMTMTEDFWFPRRGGERSTEVDTMPGGSAAGLTSDENLQYFQRKLYKSLKVPLSRLEPETMYSFGRVSEISRDEVKFGKFVKRLRTRFSTLFNIILEKQLVLKGIMGPEDFQNMKNSIRYDFITNNYFDELKEAEILRERMSTLRELEEHVGTYYSREWVVKNVLQLNDEEWKEQKETMAQEAEEAPEEAEEE
jgi:membrane-associated HD superfamily phosphohydrolase